MQLALSKMVGMESVKEDLMELDRFRHLNEQRREEGLDLPPAPKHGFNILMKGFPGVGKTSLARDILAPCLLSQLSNPNDYNEEDRFKHIEDPREIIKGHVGGADEAVREALEDTEGCVVFIDEAHQLIKPGCEKDDGPEILKAMMNHFRPCRSFIFAGYPDSPSRKYMGLLLETDPGMDRRFSWKLMLPCYSTQELFDILILQFCEGRMRVECPAVVIMDCLNTLTPAQIRAGNGGWMEMLLQVCARKLPTKELVVTEEVFRKSFERLVQEIGVGLE